MLLAFIRIILFQNPPFSENSEKGGVKKVHFTESGHGIVTCLKLNTVIMKFHFILSNANGKVTSG